MNSFLKEKYKVDVNDYKVIRKISQGGFGIIYLVRNEKNKEELVAKVSIFDESIDDQHTQFIKREISILMLVQHQTIIPLKGFSLIDFNHNKNITIFMDYMEQGSLSLLLDNEKKGLCPVEYDNTKRQIILAGIARGMMILHSKNVIHRDLSSGNVLLDKDFHPRITDFGLSKFFDPHHSKTQTINDCGTAVYMAPEVILSNKFGTKADVYSFGILMFEIVTGTRAYSDFLSNEDATIFQLKKKVTEGFRPTPKIPIKEGLNKLIQQCLLSNPNERPTFYELFQKLSLSSYVIMNQFGPPQNNFVNNFLDEEDNEQYCLDGVNLTEFLDYIEEITEEVDKNKEFEERLDSIEKVHKDEIKEMKKIIQDQKGQIDSLKMIIDKQSREIKILKSNQEKFSSSKGENNSPLTSNFGKFFYVEPSLTQRGILHCLKKREKNIFDRLFVTSLSNNDINNLIDSNTNDSFSTSNSDSKAQVEFVLEESIPINGIQITSASNFFPKSFDIQIDDTLVKSVKEANELNGKHKTMTVKFIEKRGKIIRIIKTGSSWNNTTFIQYKKFEILSSDPKFSSGVFTTLLNESKEKDPHKCKVFISASAFDLNSFYSIKSKRKVSTNIKDPQWFQVELVRGSAIITGFRLIKSYLKSYKIVATDDVNKNDDSWVTLFEIDEKVNRNEKTCDVFELQNPSPLVRFVRLIKTGPNWDQRRELAFYHFDIFGYYF